MSDLLETQRKNNYSSILPKLNKKQSLSVPKQRQASSNRYTELSRYQTPKPKKQVAMVPQYESVT